MINIKEPFHSAGIKFKWPQKPEGVGIARGHFDGEGFIELTIGKSPLVYRIAKDKARDFVNQYKSYFYVKDVPLGVLPLELFETENPTQDKLL